MIVKGNKKLTDYKYLIMFDLASKLTGICVWDLEQKKPVKTEQIKVNTDGEKLAVGQLYELIKDFLERTEKEFSINKENYFISFEAAPSQIKGGGGSTIQTFVALARAHAALDLYTFMEERDVYDYTGIYPISTHAYLKKIMEFDKDHKVTKDDIKDYVYKTYGVEGVSYDETDAVFLAQTLIEVKWNNDIKELIREQKRHKKTLKMNYSISLCDKEIERLEGLLLEEKD